MSFYNLYTYHSSGIFVCLSISTCEQSHVDVILCQKPKKKIYGNEK